MISIGRAWAAFRRWLGRPADDWDKMATTAGDEFLRCGRGSRLAGRRSGFSEARGQRAERPQPLENAECTKVGYKVRSRLHVPGGSGCDCWVGAVGRKRQRLIRIAPWLIGGADGPAVDENKLRLGNGEASQPADLFSRSVPRGKRGPLRAPSPRLAWALRPCITSFRSPVYGLRMGISPRGARGPRCGVPVAGSPAQKHSSIGGRRPILGSAPCR